MGYFEMTSPESLGISSEAIRSFLEACGRAGLELHRLMILRHGKCCAKVTWAPYGEEDLHPLYSFSKSFTATAIGFARQEGLLSLDEKIADIFPEDLPENPSENLKACTIHHLLCMSCGHETEARDFSPEWRKRFFAHPFLHEPGTFYYYNTAGTNILAAIIRKRTGLQVTEYLRPRLFDPLGIGEVPCADLPDELHTQIGGAGMKASLDTLAKFTQFMLQDGVWEGKALLPGWYHELAGVKQMETAGDSEGHIKDWACGYGYQCWLNPFPGSFRADGAFGQFGLVYPSLDLAIIMNAATEQTQTQLDAVNEYLLPNVEPAHTAGETQTDGKPFVAQLSVQGLLSCRNPAREKELAGACFVPASEADACSLEEFVGGSGLFDIRKDPVLSGLKFDFTEKALLIRAEADGNEDLITAALDGSFACSEAGGHTYAATARWRSLDKLELEVRRTDALSGGRFILTFNGKDMTIQGDDTLMALFGLGMVDRPLRTWRRLP